MPYFAGLDWGAAAHAVVRRYPTPDSARRLGGKRLATFLASQSYCGRRSPDELLARLRDAPPGHAGEGEEDACGEVAQSLAARAKRRAWDALPR